MEIIDDLRKHFGQQIALEELEPNVMRVYTPFFHEDGDMLSIYLQILGNGNLKLRDFGNTLMRVSYTFDIETANRRNTLHAIVKSNNGILDDGELILETDIEHLAQAIFQYSQIVAKVSNIEILKQETVQSYFFDYLEEYISTNYKRFTP